MALGEQEQQGFNLAVDLYTNLMFNQKELMTRIVESAYSAGLNDGIAYAQQQITQQMYSEEIPEDVEFEVPEVPKYDLPKPDVPKPKPLREDKEKDKDKDKDVRPLDIRDPGILARLRRGGGK
jgi:hypothetical protein